MGVAGSALASTISQWLGGLAGVAIVAVKLGLSRSFTFRDVTRLLSVGGDLFVRTGLLTFFLAYTTRAATQLGADAGAAHQAIRQVYSFTSLALDAYAATVQSLVGYFFGRDEMDWVRRVVRVGMNWSLWTGAALGLLMWLGRGVVIAFLIPETAVRIFLPSWAVSAVTQPISSLAFLTDGVHWGTGDYRYLRDAMIVAAFVGFGGIWLLDLINVQSLTWVWIVVGAWIAARALSGILRIWPGIGNSPFREKQM
jgi:MATE family multidrug resistance protein